MRDLRERLQTDDPLAHEPPLGAIEVETMRRRIVGYEPESRPRWSITAMLAVALVALLGLGAALTRPIAGTDAPSLDHASGGGSHLRQFQMQTPGGTRVIWIINPDFQLR
jgi:hypothetical protein